MHLLNNEGGERKSAFRQLIKDVTALDGPDGAPSDADAVWRHLAIWATRRLWKTLDVPLLRVHRGDLLPTISRQIVLHLRRQAASLQLLTVHVDDGHSARDVQDELRRDGFKPADDTGTRHQATVLRVVGAWSDVQNAANDADVSEPATSWADNTPLRAEAAECERVWWPAKITDADLPTFIVPIRGVFADDLLRHMPTLLARASDLGLSREHVYYRTTSTAQGASCGIPARGTSRWSGAHDRSRASAALQRPFIGPSRTSASGAGQVRASADNRGRVNAPRFERRSPATGAPLLVTVTSSPACPSPHRSASWSAWLPTA